MTRRLVYSKHSASDRCGVALFSALLARHVLGQHVHGFQGFRECDEFFINMDILELDEGDFSSLLSFVESKGAKRTVLIMHDYRFSYLEDQLVRACDLVVNLSGEPGLGNVAGDKMMDLPTPPLTEPPILGLSKKHEKPLSLAFGYFSPRKKSFQTYIRFYEHMLSKYPNWYHIIVASSHSGDNSSDSQMLARLLDSGPFMFMDYMPGQMLAELIAVADVGVCFYPTGIMRNNAAPMSFFSQGKTVITTFGELTPSDFRHLTLDAEDLDGTDFSDGDALKRLGAAARDYYNSNLTWDIFLGKIYERLA